VGCEARVTLRSVDENRLLRNLQRSLNHVAIPKSFLDWFRAQPRHPKLVGSTEAARILGVPKPHVARLRAQGRMPEPFTVQGGHDVYVKSEVVQLGRQLERERKARASGRK
jgi:hypothetical protein